MPVAFSMMTWHCIAYCCADCIRGNVVSLWRSFVTTERVSLLGLKNRQGHWLCRMSTGRKNGLRRRTHTKNIEWFGVGWPRRCKTRPSLLQRDAQRNTHYSNFNHVIIAASWYATWWFFFWFFLLFPTPIIVKPTKQGYTYSIRTDVLFSMKCRISHNSLGVYAL